MPMRTELVALIFPRDSVTRNRDLLAVTTLCILGLALSFTFIACTRSFEQIATMASAIPWD